MNEDKRHQMLFALALEQAQKPAFATALNLARLVKDEVKRLSNAQINGLAEMANNSAHFKTVDTILEELEKRNDARWKSKKNPVEPYTTMNGHISQLREDADVAVAQAEKTLAQALAKAREEAQAVKQAKETLAQATDASIAQENRDRGDELHLKLTRHYLDAAATLARTARAAAPLAQQEE